MNYTFDISDVVIKYNLQDIYIKRRRKKYTIHNVLVNRSIKFGTNLICNQQEALNVSKTMNINLDKKHSENAYNSTSVTFNLVV